jgi:DNA polymerase
MAKKLHVDIETFSSVDIMSSGAYKYMESIDFEILIVAFAFDNDPIEIIDLAQGEVLPEHFIQALLDPTIEKHAHNANFERQAFKQIGYDVPASEWHCSAVKAAYSGLPLSLEAVSKAMALEEKAKSATGKALIKFFSCPIKPTKVNGMRERNFPKHDLIKWEQYKLYCMQDVEAEREIDNRLISHKIPEFERLNYILDQKINDKGILIDLIMAKNAYEIDERFSLELENKVKDLTEIDNPNSAAQLKVWLSSAMQKEIKTLAKGDIPLLIQEAGPGIVSDVLGLRKKLSKSSTKKYTAMLNCACEDERAHGLFQFYGANRTGRWAGRLVQLQNLPQNHISDLQEARNVIASGDYDHATMLYDDVSSILSQLIRTTFIAKPGFTFAVADFSAIEARVIAWLANEKWRLDVFNTHGKIYEASASMMFNVPIESVTKGSDLRDKGKIAELALGYQGALGALTKMGGEKMGLSDMEMTAIVKKWRKANLSIVDLWKDVETCAIRAIEKKSTIISKYRNLEFSCDGEVFTIKLPSGRKLYYQKPSFSTNKWDQKSIKYKGMDQVTKQWIYVDTYGGKLVENIVQAIARDLLAYSMLKIDRAGFEIVMHVHDEVVCEIPEENQETHLEKMCYIMGQEVPWALGLPNRADGYLTEFYKKD